MYHLEKISNKDRTETMGLSKTLWLKVGIRYMIVVKINVLDSVVNGSTGVLQKIDYSNDKNKKPIRLWIELDEKKVVDK